MTDNQNPRVKDVSGKDAFTEVANSNEIVLVDFWAPWCAPCRTLKPMLEKIVSDNETISLAKVNIDEVANQDIAFENGVNAIPHVVIYKNGAKIDEFVGAIPYDQINTILSQYKTSAAE